MKKIIDFFKKLFSKTKSIFYLGSTDILPEPLSKEMEEYYVSLKDDGDLSAKDKLIEHNLRLVVFLAKKYENTSTDLEDLVYNIKYFRDVVNNWQLESVWEVRKLF